MSFRVTGPGQPGKDGAIPTFSIFSVNTLPPGSAAMVQLDGTATAKTFTFGIPAGYNGTPGTTPNIVIGTVTTVAAGGSATASITGTTPNLTLNLGIPAGVAGSAASATPLGNATPQPLGTPSTGVSANTSREDHVHALPAIPAASSTTPIVAGTAAVGVGTTYARADHVHPAQAVPVAATATPLASVASGAIGTGTTFARADHQHPLQSGTLTLVGTATVGETTLIALSLGVKRYSVSMAGLAVGDRVIAMLTGAPGASSLQDVYVSATNTLNVGLLNPALGIGSVIAVPIAVFKVV